MKKRGYTLIELLCVLGIIALLSAVSIPIIGRVNIRSQNKADNAVILIIDRAMNNYRFNDYSVAAATFNKRVTFEENGMVKINSELNMDSSDIAALSNSGKGVYPQTKEECLAMIKIYTGNDFVIKAPEKGSSYDFCYNRQTGKTSVMRIEDIPVGIRSQYVFLTGG